MKSLLLLVLGLIACQPSQQYSIENPVWAEGGTKLSFNVGGSRFILFDVGSFDMKVEELLPQATAPQLERAGMQHQTIPFRMQSLFIDTGKARIIVEPAGFEKTAQNLHRLLKEEGIALESIDTVIITHAHFDHFGASITADGKPAFANATYYIQKAEWDHWLQPEGEPDFLVTGFQQNLLPLQQHFQFVEGEQTIVAGIKAIPTPGHSPGHMSIQIGERLFYTGDSILQPVQVEHPQWLASWNLQPDQVLTSRKAFLQRIDKNKGWLIGTHFPNPAIGAVRKDHAGYHWIALEPRNQ